MTFAGHAMLLSISRIASGQRLGQFTLSAGGGSSDETPESRRPHRKKQAMSGRATRGPPARASRPSPGTHSPVPPCQLLVWNGEAGRPSLLTRFGLATFRQPKRTWVGAATPLASTTTVSPSIVASAGTNLPSAPAISNSLKRLAVARLQAAADVGEREPDLAALDLHRLVERPRVDEVLLAVILGQRPEGQPLAHVELVDRVDVLDVVDQVGRDHHARLGDLQAGRLGLPEGVQLAGRVIAEGRELDEVEGEIVPPRLPPTPDQGLVLS